MSDTAFYRRENVSMSGASLEYNSNILNQKKKIYVYGGMSLMTGGTMIPGLISIDEI